MVAEGFAVEPGLGAEPGVPLCLTTGDFWLLGVVTGPSLGEDGLPLPTPTTPTAEVPVAEVPVAAVLLVGLVAVAVVLLPLATVVAPAHAPPDVPFTMGDDDVTAVVEAVPVVVLAP